MIGGAGASLEGVGAVAEVAAVAVTVVVTGEAAGKGVAHADFVGVGAGFKVLPEASGAVEVDA
jgi:hypothetical protein